jgi:uncharacterized protein (TIGR02466 family)
MINLFSTPVKVVSINNFIEINNLCGKAMSKKFINNIFENLDEEESKYFQNLFLNEAENYYQEIIGKKINLKIVSSWTSITKKYEIVTPHAHPQHTLVGVYYIRTPDQCGDLLLHDPRGSNDFDIRFEKDKYGNNFSHRSFYRIKPKIGDLIFYPAYLAHSVEPNMSDDIRISLAINFKYKDFNQFKPD